MKKLVILTLLFIGLGAFVYFYEIVGEEKREEERKLEERLLRLEEDEIQGLEITRLGGPALVLKREGDGWVLKSPLETSADQGSVDALLRNLINARRVRTFENVGESAGKYGLADPSIRLTVETTSTRKVLLIGNKDYTGNELYVKFQGEPQVFLSSALILSSLDKELIDWRDKRILSFDRDKLQELRILRASEEIVLVKVADHWALEAPIEEPADDETVSGLISTLEAGRAKRFVTEDEEDLTEYGLASPSAVVRVRQEAEDTWRQLELGSQNEEEVFARNSSRPAIFTVEKDILKDLFQDIWEFRSKEVVNVDQDEIAKLTIDAAETRIVARREEFKWILEEPENEKDKEVLAYKFWYPLEDIEFESISDDRTLEFPQPAIRVLLTLKDGTERSFDFAAQGNQYLARQVETGRHGQISKENFEKLEFKVEDITG